MNFARIESLLERDLAVNPPARRRPRVRGPRPSFVAGLVAVLVGLAAWAGVAPGPQSLTSGSATALVPTTGHIVSLADGSLSVRRPNGTAERTFGGVGQPYRLYAISPDGTSVAAVRSSGNRELVVISLRDGNVRQLLTAPTGFVIGNVRWSADGVALYYIQERERSNPSDAQSIFRLRVDDVVPIEVTPRVGSYFESLGVLPDGRILFVAQARESGEGLTPYVADADGRNATPLLGVLPTGKACRTPAVSANGQRVALLCSLGAFQQPSIVTIDLRTGRTNETALRGNGAGSLTWSGDGVNLVLAVGSVFGCGFEIYWYDSESGVQELAYQDANARMTVIAGTPQSALVSRTECQNDSLTYPSNYMWIDRSGRTFPVSQAAEPNSAPQILWMER